MSLVLWERYLSGTVRAGLRKYPSEKGSSAAIVYPEEFSGSNTIDRYRQGINVRSIDDLYMYIGMKPQPINDLLKVRDGRIIFGETPFDDNDAPLNMGITTDTIYSGTIIYSASFNNHADELNGLLAPSIGSGTVRFFRANDAAITKANIDTAYVWIEDAAVPHQQKIKFIFDKDASDITKAANVVTIGISAMSDIPGALNSINSGSLAARLVEAINSGSAAGGLAVKAFSGSIPASNFFTGTRGSYDQLGQSDTVAITQNDVGTLIGTRSLFDGYDLHVGTGIKEGSGGQAISVNSTTYMSASGFDGARTVLFLSNSSGLIGTRSLYTAGTVSGGSTHYIFNGKDYVENASSDPQYRFLQSTQRYGKRGTNVNIKYRLLKAPFNSTEGSGIHSGTWGASPFTGNKPETNTGDGLYIEASNTGLTGSWYEVSYHSPDDFTSGFATDVTSSVDCWTGPKHVRFIQKKFHSPDHDHWAISDLFIEENTRKQDSVQPSSMTSRIVLDPSNSQSGVRTAPNHFWDDRDLGMTDVYQDGELFKDTATVNPVEIIIQDPLTIDIPKMMVDASDQGLMDGVLEPFPIRSVADRSNIQLPYTARGIKADMTLTDVYRKSDTISQEFRKRSVRSSKLPLPYKKYSGDSNFLIIPISSSLGRVGDYRTGAHLATTGSAVRFFVPSYQIPVGREYLTKDEIASGSSEISRAGRYMTILLHQWPDLVVTGVHSGSDVGNAYNYRQIAVGPLFWEGYTSSSYSWDNSAYNASAAGAAAVIAGHAAWQKVADANIVSVAARLRDDIVKAINGVIGNNIARGLDTTSNFGIRAESLGGVITGTLGGSNAKFFRIRLTAVIPGKHGDDILINQVSGTDATPGNELVNGTGEYNFAGGKGFLRQRRRNVLMGNDSYFDGVELFGADILDDAARVKQRVLQVIVDSETGDTAPVEAYEDWVAMNISGTYGKSHLAPIQLQGFVGPSNATVGAFDDASDTILRVRGINDAADLFAASDESYTTLLNASFKSINTTIYGATTSSGPVYTITETAGAGTTNESHPKLGASYFISSVDTDNTAPENLIAHYSFVGSTSVTKRSNTSVDAVTQGSFSFDSESPFIKSQNVGSVKVDASSVMQFPSVITMGSHRSFSGTRQRLPEHYLRVKGEPTGSGGDILGDYITIVDAYGSYYKYLFAILDLDLGGSGATASGAGTSGSPYVVNVGLHEITSSIGTAQRLASVINKSGIEVTALTGSDSFLGEATSDGVIGHAGSDSIKLVSHIPGDGLLSATPNVNLTGGTDYITGSVTLNSSIAGVTGNTTHFLGGSYPYTKFTTGSLGHRDGSFTLSFWMKGDGDRNFYLAQSYCATDTNGATNYGSRNWNIRFTGYDYESYAYQYMYFYLFDNKNYPTNYSWIFRRFYGHNSGAGYGNSKLVNAMTDGNWHHWVISYDGDITSTLTHNENLPKKKGVGKIIVKTNNLEVLHNRYFIIYDVTGNYTYFKFKSDNTIVDGSYVSGQTLFINVGISGCTSVQDIAQRIASTVNVVTSLTQSPDKTLHAHAYTYGSSGPSYYASSGGANIINFGSSPAELSFSSPGDTITNTGYASVAETLTADGTVLIVQRYAGEPRSIYMYDNISDSYMTTVNFVGHDGVEYDNISNYYIGITPMTVDGKSHEHFKLYIDGIDTTEDDSSSSAGSMYHYNAGTSGAGTRYDAMGKNEPSNIEFCGLSSYNNWSSYIPSIFVENPVSEIAFYQGMLDPTSITAIYEMSLIQDVDMLSAKPLVAALMKSNVSAQDLLSRDHVSATAGYEYNNNVEVGTDSLAFGGLKK